MDGLWLLVFPRVLHVLGVVLWIGGVALVASVVLPVLRRWDDPELAYRQFQFIVQRFAWQARVTTLVVGLSGFHMLGVMQAWDRYLQASYWWVWLMTFVWLIFTVMLFFVQPLRRRSPEELPVPKDPQSALAGAHRMHWILLSLSLLAVAGAVAGAHGWFWI
ncbi:MAG: hypothetical protein Kow006_04190 [Gammaproteobacteria bacterium]